MDSITLVFVIGHFCFLLWVQGHVWTLQSREAEYKAAMTIYNEKAERVSTDNAKIAEAARQIAEQETKRARIENDSIYQARKAAQAGAKIDHSRRGQSLAPSLMTSPIELERPEKPKESSTDFLTRWDLWVRLANFGELALAAITFIYIRNRSAKFNASYARDDDGEFPDELDVFERSPIKRGMLATTQEKRRHIASAKNADTDADKEKTQTVNVEGLKKLRDALKDISFRFYGVSFKVDVRGDAVWIRLMKSEHREQRTIASTRASLTILDDALKMTPDEFRLRLEQFLTKRGFTLNSATG